MANQKCQIFADLWILYLTVNWISLGFRLLIEEATLIHWLFFPPMFWCIEDHKNILMRSETMNLCTSLFSFHFSFYLDSLPAVALFASFALLPAVCIQFSPTQSLPRLNVPPLFTLYVSVSLYRPVWHMVTSVWLFSVGAQGSVLALPYCYTIDCLLFDYHVQKIRTSVSKAHTHAHRVDWCLLGDKCVAGMVIRKKINTHTQWTSVSLSVSFSQYLQHNWSTYN